MKRLAIIGLALTLVGVALSVGFWPLTTVSGADLLASRNASPQYLGYSLDSGITVHERILRVEYIGPFLGGPITTLELEDGSPQQTMVIYVRGDATTVVKDGDLIYAWAVLRNYGGFLYWEVPTPSDVHQSWPIDAVFYGIMAVGVAILAYAALRKP